MTLVYSKIRKACKDLFNNTVQIVVRDKNFSVDKNYLVEVHEVDNIMLFPKFYKKPRPNSKIHNKI